MTSLSVGDCYAGFHVDSNHDLKEINARLWRLTHGVTGARLSYLETSDPNNLFAVGFRTPPADSTGVAHILEHTVLCGSQNFPVRDPFFAMLKRSLNTFMNAMTSSDWTLYPFSSMNRKDYDNLLSIYLDATFFPLLREEDFCQEGHRLEFTVADDPDSALAYKGVVYNEMKGAMADPSSLVSRRLHRHLFPTTTYRHNSGGEPGDIPALTHAALKAFHAEYYHPSNAWFFLYGSFSLEEQLAMIEERVLKHFGKRKVNSQVGSEQRLTAPLRINETFPLPAGEAHERKTIVQIGWLTCDIEDRFECFSLGVLASLLLGNPAAPLYRALIESGLGSGLAPGIGYHDDYRSTYFAAGLQGTHVDSTEAIEKLIIQTLEEVVAQGFTPERIEGVLHRLEFSQREVSGDHYPYPLALLMRLFGSWLHCDDPLSPLQLEDCFRALRDRLTREDYFEDLIRRQLLDNPHRVTLTLRPDPEQQSREDQALAEKLSAVRSSFTTEDCDALVRQAAELQRGQEQEENLACLPNLTLTDIPAEETAVPYLRCDHRDRPIYRFDQPTNGIGYFAAHFTTDGLPDELRPWVPLSCALLNQIGAAGYDYQQMATRIESGTGGVGAGTDVLVAPASLTHFDGLVAVRGKALTRNQPTMYEILRDMLTAPDFTNLERLATIIGQMKTGLENSIPGSGHSYAARSAAAGLFAAGRLREEWAGISFFQRLKALAALPTADLAEPARMLAETATRLFCRANLTAAVTCEEANFPAVETPLQRFIAALPPGAPHPATLTPFRASSLRIGWVAPVPVSYVAQVFPAVPYAHPDAAPLQVLAKLMRAGYLHREIREKGGAYGGMAGYNAEGGTFSLLSYRDPHVQRTLDVYDAAARWAARGDFDDAAVKEAIIAVFADLDRPLSPGGRGAREFANQCQGLTCELREQMRAAILEVDRDHLVAVAEHYLVAGREHSAVAVVASEELLQAANTTLAEKLEIRPV